MREFLPEFGYFGGDDELAVPLVWIAREVLLMIIFSRIEGLERRKLCDDGVEEELFGGKLRDNFFRLSLLLSGGVENSRAVLGAHICALAVERGRVVDGEEDVQNISKRDGGGVEGDSDHLGMPCGAAANLFIGGVRTFAAGIARDNVCDAPDLVIDRFEAPETSAGKHGLVEWLSIHKDNSTLIGQENLSLSHFIVEYDCRRKLAWKSHDFKFILLKQRMKSCTVNIIILHIGELVRSCHLTAFKRRLDMHKFLIILALVALFTGAMSPFAATRQQQVITVPPAEPIRLVFIHHSTGGNWLADPAQNELGGDLGRMLAENNYYVSATNYGWGPDSIGDATDIPNWLDWFSGERSDVYLEALYTESGQNFGDFGSWPRLDAAPEGENRIIVFKSCFPNSDLEGNPDDEAAPEGWLTVSNAKYVYNEILKYFATRPDKLFVVITAPPLSQSSNSKNARAFNLWLVNDWLLENNYTLNNVAVFDFYNVLTGPDNHHQIVNGEVEHTSAAGMNVEYYPSGDDHPSREGNSKATAEFIPMLNAFYNRWAATAPTDVVAEPLAEQTDSADAAVETVLAPAMTQGYAENFESGAPGWEGYFDEGGNTTLDCAVSNEEAFEGDISLKMSFDVKPDGWATCGVNFDSAQNWSESQGLAITAQGAASGAAVHVDVYAGSGDARETYYAELDTSTLSSEWVSLQILWAQFKRVEWEENGGETFTKADQVLGIAFGVPSEANGTLWVDDIRLLGSAAEEAIPTLVEEAQPDEEETVPAKRGLPFCGGAAALPLAMVGGTYLLNRRITRRENR